MSRHLPSWNEVIDPSFDRILKTVVLSFRKVKAQENIQPDAALIDAAKDIMKYLAQFYEEEANGEIFKIVGLWGDQQFSEQMQFLADNKGHIPDEKMYSFVVELSKGLTSKSKEYYQAKFTPYRSMKELEDFKKKMNDEEKRQWQNSINADLLSLGMHKTSSNVASTVKAGQAEQIKEKMNTYQIAVFNFGMLNLLSQIINKKPLKTLYKEAKSGDRKSLLKLLRIDKTVITHEWVTTLLQDAMITDDKIFLKQIGDALKKQLSVAKQKQVFLKLILRTYWPYGLYKLSYRQLGDLLTESGITIQKNFDSFEKLIKDEIKPLFPQLN